MRWSATSLVIMRPRTSRQQWLALQMESAEPNIGGVQSAYPEGEYFVYGFGDRWRFPIGIAELTHNLVPAPQFSPQVQELDIHDGLIEWLAVDDASGYIVEIENDDLGFNMTVDVDAAVTQVRVPAVFLVAGESYEIGVASVSADGNVSIAESEFSVR